MTCSYSVPHILNMEKCRLPPPRVSPRKLRIQEIKLFDGYETLKTKPLPENEKSNDEATGCSLCFLYFSCIFLAALVVTLILAYHFES